MMQNREAPCSPNRCNDGNDGTTFSKNSTRDTEMEEWDLVALAIKLRVFQIEKEQIQARNYL